MARLTKAEEAALWRAFKERGCQEARTALIERHESLVSITRRRYFPIVPKQIDPADLEAEGRVALVNAVDRYQPARGVKFTSFCISMLRGAMLEYMRQEDWAPRSRRDKERRIKAAEAQVLAHGNAVTDERLADALEMDLGAFYELQRGAIVYDVLGLDDTAHLIGAGSESDPRLIGDAMADPSPGPEQIVLKRETEAILIQVVAELSAPERALIHDYYYEERTLKQIAQRMDRSESRAHQIFQAALSSLSRRLGPTVHFAREG